MATFEQYMAESGRQGELDQLGRTSGAIDKAREAYNRTGSYFAGMESGLPGEADSRLKQGLINQLIDLDAKLSSLSVSLSDQEKDQILQKATQQIEPYYQQKKIEIEKGIAEGKIRTAENLLIELQNFDQETANSLAKFDLTNAQTEEEFTNRIAALTENEATDLETNRLQWMDRVKQAKQAQSTGTAISGIGRKEITDLNTQAQLDRQGIENRYNQAKQSAETTKKYTLESIALARKDAEQKRLLKYGGQDPTQVKQSLIETAGLNPDEQISEVLINQRRAQRNINPLTGSALTEMEAEKQKALESRKLQLQEDELAVRKQSANAEASRKRADVVKNLNGLGYYSANNTYGI